MLIKSGIYKIINLKNNKFYIGSAFNLNRRKIEHFSKLKHNKHHNPYLQKSVNKHGISFFKFEVIEYCPQEKCIDLEQIYIDTLNPHYNLIYTARNKQGVNRPKKLTKEKVLKIIELLNTHILIRSISEQLSVTESTIQDIKQGRTWKRYTEFLKEHSTFKGYENGEKSRLAKLKEIEVIEIINKINESIPLNIIAKEYSVNSAQICSIRKGRNWKHLTHLVKNSGVKYKNSK